MREKTQNKFENESMLSNPGQESPVKPAVEIAEEFSERMQNKNFIEIHEPKTARRPKSNVGLNHLDKSGMEKQTHRRLRSARKQ